MRRPTLVLLGIAAPVALATAIFFYHWRANRVQAEEGIAFNPPELNVGPIPPGQSKHFDFVLANLHDGETRIRGVEATCGCMDVQLSRPSAARGENITVAGSIRPG